MFLHTGSPCYVLRIMEICRIMRYFRKYPSLSNYVNDRRSLAIFLNKKLSKWFALPTLFCASAIQNNSTLDGKKNLSDELLFNFSHRKLIQQACSGSVNSASELLTQILLAVIDSASRYKDCLNDLMSDLEQSNELLGHGTVNPKTEDDIINARIQAKKLKEEFLELVTMLEHIEKLVTATAEVSFLSGSETLAMLVSERLYSVQQKIQNEMEEVKKIENEYLEIQKSSIERSQ